jgi:hypothetical protein
MAHRPSGQVSETSKERMMIHEESSIRTVT